MSPTNKAVINRNSAQVAVFKPTKKFNATQPFPVNIYEQEIKLKADHKQVSNLNFSHKGAAFKPKKVYSGVSIKKIPVAAHI